MEIFKSWLVKNYIAHRGLHDETSPENSLSAFEKAIKEGYAIETDVQIISDGTVVVFHDEKLARMTGEDGYTKNLKFEDLERIKLLDSKEHIPTFEEFLKYIDGKAPLLIEIKNSGKVGILEQKVLEILKNYKGEYAIQSFNPFVLDWFKDNAPEILRGQLAGYFKGEDLSWVRKFALKRMLFNKRVQPHFISYEGKSLPNRFVRRWRKLPLLAWTIRSQEEYLKVIKHCDNIIFENFEPKI